MTLRVFIAFAKRYAAQDTITRNQLDMALDDTLKPATRDHNLKYLSEFVKELEKLPSVREEAVVVRGRIMEWRDNA